MSTSSNLPRYQGRRTRSYVAPKDAAEIVNFAIDLKRPILVEGEPGCGKTRLAYSIAEELGLGDPVHITVKSTSRAQDLLYRVNTLKRFQDAQNPGDTEAQFLYPYLSLGPLGEAINSKRRRVILIDEVDKADIDFPNDLLEVFDRLRFKIDDLPDAEVRPCEDRNGFGREVIGDEAAPPIVVITSNREKRLPEPFLRRCLYIRMKFPFDETELVEIVKSNTPDIPDWNAEILTAAIQAFKQVRGVAEAMKMQKLPATGELIDWTRILYLKNETAEALKADPKNPPYWQTLFKTMPDLDKYASALASKTASEAKG